MSTTQTKTIRFNIRADIDQTLQNQQNLVFRERRNNQSIKTSNSKQVKDEVWQLGYKQLKWQQRIKIAMWLQNWLIPWFLFFFSFKHCLKPKKKLPLHQKSTNSAVLDILKRSNGAEISNYVMSNCSELRKSIYGVDTRLMYKHSVESRISESQAVNMSIFAR